jgi:diaminopimelate epimerase
MKFTKMQGTGNDYIYVDARTLDKDWSMLSRVMSDRHFGIGSDGIVLIQSSNVADLKMRMFNADGSESEMCGNGIRCFVKYVIERGIVPAQRKRVIVETMAGVRTVIPMYDGNRVMGARVSMGLPRLDPSELPVILKSGHGFRRGPVINHPFRLDSLQLPLTFVSMGNPHAVTFLDHPVAEFPLSSIGPRVERHPMFPNRVNFEVVRVSEEGKFTARVWERGSGETLACGTGACAIAVAARLLDLGGEHIDITLPGGILGVDWDGEGEVFLEGPAEEVFSGEWMV